MTMIADAMAMIASGLEAAFGVVGGVTYTPLGGAAQPGTVAWVGRTVFRQDQQQGNGASVVFGDRDYIVPVSELAALPKRGDRIAEVIGGVTLLFEVVAPGNEPPWRYSDPARSMYRLHCKKVG